MHITRNLVNSFHYFQLYEKAKYIFVLAIKVKAPGNPVTGLSALDLAALAAASLPACLPACPHGIMLREICAPIVTLTVRPQRRF